MSGRTGFQGWQTVQRRTRQICKGAGIPEDYLNNSQRGALSHLAKAMKKHGAVLADEVGLGKTRIAVALARAVIDKGGRVAIVVPPVVEAQWREEFKGSGEDIQPMLRSLDGLLWEAQNHGDRAADSLVLLSHRFGDIRANNKRMVRRTEFLRALHHIAKGRKQRQWHYGGQVVANGILERSAACKFTDDAVKTILPSLGERPRFSEARFGSDGLYQPLLERAVGLILGPFDLVIIDEAHKSRSSHSKLSVLLDGILLTKPDTRRLCLTATPVELDVSQWEPTLARVGVNKAERERIDPSVRDYADAVRQVRRRWRSDPNARKQYKEASAAFEKALGNYMVRRDKRGDETVRLFREHVGEHRSYRSQDPIKIELTQLEQPWRSSVFAAEALSQLGTDTVGTLAQRARLTMGNGHGIAAIIDAAQRPENKNAADDEQAEVDGSDADTLMGAERGELENDELATAAEHDVSKREKRARWWHEVLLAPVRTQGHPLYGHPAVLAAAEEIEQHVKDGDKVLVFGRYTRPMQALVRLLNARALLRAVDADEPWPQENVAELDEPAFYAVVQAEGKGRKLSDVNRHLAQGYNMFEARRKRLRNTIIDAVERGLTDDKLPDGDGISVSDGVEMLQAIRAASLTTYPEDSGLDIIYLVRAIDTLLMAETDASTVEYADVDLARAFLSVMGAVRERGEGDADGNEELDAEEAQELWPILSKRLREEHESPRASFARLMYGSTPPSTRRLLQLAFNRQETNPKVLVAQSLVGREGLNLHEACRIVVLLHLEWNPGVVEQQIGRVDRLGSDWARRFKHWVEDKGTNAEPPCIKVRPVVFSGTYDDRHWDVLSTRWDDLRAQLHGLAVPMHQRESGNLTKEQIEIVRQLDEAAPNFDPSRKSVN